jgi:membrane-associated phospholipid phosphatase
MFRNIGKNIRIIFSPRYLWWHVAAIVITYVLVVSGFDWTYVGWTTTPLLRVYIFPAILLGGLLPILIPIALYILGLLKKSVGIVTVAFALGQAALLGSCISSLYKAFTGRAHPEFGLSTTLDITRDFSFGFWRGGIFWGWPSSHTTIAFAMAFALIALFPKRKSVVIPALLYAFYVGFSVSVSIHWFSDFVAGSIFGTLIGVVVGRSFKIFDSK